MIKGEFVVVNQIAINHLKLIGINLIGILNHVKKSKKKFKFECLLLNVYFCSL